VGDGGIHTAMLCEDPDEASFPLIEQFPVRVFQVRLGCAPSYADALFYFVLK